MRRWIPFVLAALLPAAASAQAYRAINDLYVVPLGANTFEVIEDRGEGPLGIWCAAADFAERRLGARDRIYIRDGRGPARSMAGRKGVVFTTDPGNLAAGPFTSRSLTTSRVGVGLRVAHAIQFCRPDDFDLTERLFRRGY